MKIIDFPIKLSKVILSPKLIRFNGAQRIEELQKDIRVLAQKLDFKDERIKELEAELRRMMNETLQSRSRRMAAASVASSTSGDQTSNGATRFGSAGQRIRGHAPSTWCG